MRIMADCRANNPPYARTIPRINYAPDSGHLESRGTSLLRALPGNNTLAIGNRTEFSESSPKSRRSGIPYREEQPPAPIVQRCRGADDPASQVEPFMR